MGDPSIFYLDEPTSGIDANFAHALVVSLKTIASQGRTVLATIHQPSSQVFQLFDRVLLLADGRMAYFGPVADMASYFTSIGYLFPPLYNAADYMRMCSPTRFFHLTSTQGSALS